MWSFSVEILLVDSMCIITVGVVMYVRSTCVVNHHAHDPFLTLCAIGAVQILNPLLLSAISVSQLKQHVRTLCILIVSSFKKKLFAVQTLHSHTKCII